MGEWETWGETSFGTGRTGVCSFEGSACDHDEWNRRFVRPLMSTSPASKGSESPLTWKRQRQPLLILSSRFTAGFEYNFILSRFYIWTIECRSSERQIPSSCLRGAPGWPTDCIIARRAGSVERPSAPPRIVSSGPRSSPACSCLTC